MHARIRHFPAALHPAPPLALRGGLARTFGGLAAFLVVTFLCWGIYLLEDAFVNPLAAQAVALIFGAFIIALGTILLFYLIKPGSRYRMANRQRPGSSASLPEREFLEEVSLMVRANDGREDLVYQRVYKDHSRIRL